MDHEVTRQRHVDYLTSRLPEHIERLTWSAERLRAERTARLRELLAVARLRSPWHRQRLSGVDIDRMDEDRLADLPVMIKDDLMAHFDEIVTDPGVRLDLVNAHIAGLTSDAYMLGDLHAVASGGSSGVRGVFVWGWEAWAEATLPTFRRQVSETLRDPALATRPPATMVVAAENAAHFTSAAPQTFANPKVVPVHRFPVTSPLAAIVDGLNRVNGTALVAYASMLSTLAAEAHAGRLTIAPLRVMATAEPLLPEIRAAAMDAWGAPIANIWGTSEAGITALGCFRDSGMHLSDDLVVIEPVDAHGNPVPPGTRSAKIHLTNLFNTLLPLIRYEITDEVTVLDEPCACGSAHRRIADIQGRLDDTFTYPTGGFVHPHVFRSVLGRDARITEYQVQQTPRGAEVLLCARAPVQLESIARALAAELARAGCSENMVTMTIVDHLPRQASGKLKRFVPLGAALR